MLDVYRGGAKLTSMRVAVGTTKTKTPMLLLRDPLGGAEPAVERADLDRFQANSCPRGAPIWHATASASSPTARAAPGCSRRPGPGNSLGRIKFDFKNDFGVYLHDTSAKAVFERDARSVSHGCVRVERPEELAQLLLEDDPSWSGGRIEQVLAETETVRASTPEKMAVMLLYWTVFRDDSGQMNFRNDIYGWDEELVKLMRAGRMAT